MVDWIVLIFDFVARNVIYFIAFIIIIWSTIWIDRKLSTEKGQDFMESFNFLRYRLSRLPQYLKRNFYLKLKLLQKTQVVPKDTLAFGKFESLKFVIPKKHREEFMLDLKEHHMMLKESNASNFWIFLSIGLQLASLSYHILRIKLDKFYGASTENSEVAD